MVKRTLHNLLAVERTWVYRSLHRTTAPQSTSSFDSLIGVAVELRALILDRR